MTFQPTFVIHKIGQVLKGAQAFGVMLATYKITVTVTVVRSKEENPDRAKDQSDCRIRYGCPREKKTKKQKIQNKIKQLKNYCFVEGSVMDISSKPSIDRLVVFSSQKSREICLSSATQAQSCLKDTISVFCCREDRESAWFCNRCLSFQQRTRWCARWRVLNREK